MIELKNDNLVFSFPEVHPDARLEIEFERTLRIPDDGKDHYLPPGLGSFPIRHIDDFEKTVPPHWLDHGGVMLPMYQAEALWINFSGSDYPFAVKIATGKINAVTGEEWVDGIHKDPQDYLVTPDQPWLDGYCVEKGVVRQFVAMPLGKGYTTEEQITGKADVGGFQIIAYPMKRAVYEKMMKEKEEEPVLMYSKCLMVEECSPEMGIAPGGRMKQEIYDDPYNFEDWDLRNSSRCFVHIANSTTWKSVTGDNPPTNPPTPSEYERQGFPWFDYYDEKQTAVQGSSVLNKVKSVVEKGKEKGETPIEDNKSISGEKIFNIHKGKSKDTVREGEF